MICWKYITMIIIFTNVVKAKQTKQREKRTIIGGFPQCPRGCTSCSPLNGCVTCKAGRFMLLKRHGARQTGSCLRKCPGGYYGLKRIQYNKCYKCRIDNCRRCMSRNRCSDCKRPYLSHEGKCVKKCPANLYYAYHSKNCKYKVDCAVGTWSNWGPCVKNGRTCGYRYGTTTRARRVLDPPSPNGSRCPETSQSKRCRMHIRYCEDLEHNKSDPSPTQKRQRRRRKKKKKRRKGHGRRKFRKRIRGFRRGMKTNDIRAVLIEKS